MAPQPQTHGPGRLLTPPPPLTTNGNGSGRARVGPCHLSTCLRQAAHSATVPARVFRHSAHAAAAACDLTWASRHEGPDSTPPCIPNIYCDSSGLCGRCFSRQIQVLLWGPFGRGGAKSGKDILGPYPARTPSGRGGRAGTKHQQGTSWGRRGRPKMCEIPHKSTDSHSRNTRNNPTPHAKRPCVEVLEWLGIPKFAPFAEKLSFSRARRHKNGRRRHHPCRKVPKAEPGSATENPRPERGPRTTQNTRNLQKHIPERTKNPDPRNFTKTEEIRGTPHRVLLKVIPRTRRAKKIQDRRRSVLV